MIASFETRPSGTAIAKKALRSSLDAFGEMKPLCLSAIAISLALGVATFYVPLFQAYVFKSQTLTLTSGAFATYMAVSIVSIVAWTAVAAPIAVAVHRFILLGRITPGYFSFGQRHTKLFFLWGAGLQMSWMLLVEPSSFLVVKQSSIIGGLVSFAFGILVLIISVHLAMIFPAIATEVPSARWQTRIAKSWRQMTGHSWLFVRAVIITFLPWVLVYLFFWVLFGGLRASQHHGDLQHSSRLGLALVLGGARIPFVILGAAVASWLYAWVRQEPSQSSSSGAAV